MERLQTKMEWSIFELEESGIKLNLTATSGIVTYDFNGTGRDELILRARQALQRASNNGPDKIYVFDDQVDGMLEEPMLDVQNE